jgi:hypothetical protein
MAIACKDFVPSMTRSGFFSSDYEPLEAVVARANEWMANVGARVVNVETVLLPNLSDEVQSGQSGLQTSGELRSQWFQIVRVWYEVERLPADAPPLLPPSG